MINKLKEAPVKTIGTKQTLKALDEDQVSLVFIAEDAEEHVTANLKEMCLKKGIEIVTVSTMRELGDACKIQVGAASAAILKS